MTIFYIHCRNAIFHHLTWKPLLERKRSKVQPIFGIDETLMFKEVISISSHLPSLLQCWHLLKYFRRYFDIYISIAWHGHILHINPNRVWNIKYQDFFSILLKYRYFWRFWMRWMFSRWIMVWLAKLEIHLIYGFPLQEVRISWFYIHDLAMEAQ